MGEVKGPFCPYGRLAQYDLASFRAFWICSDFSCLPKVSLTTVAELYNGDDHTVNRHRHGFQRNVKEEENAKETKVGAHG